MTEQVNVPTLRFGEFDSEIRFERLADVIRSYSLGGNYGNSLQPNLNPLMKMGNLGRGAFKLDKIEYIDSSEDISSDDEIKHGDLFFNTRNTLDLVGKVAIWRRELERAFYNSNLLKLEFDNNFYYNYVFNSPQRIKALRRLATGTTSVAAIYTRDLLKVNLPVPALPEQQKIASFLSAVDKKIELLTEKEAKLTEYKKGVMQQLFNGSFSHVSHSAPNSLGEPNDKPTFTPPTLRFKADDGSEFPDWEENTVGYYTEQVNGFAFKSEDLIEGQGEHRLMRGINITEGSIRHSGDIDRFYNGDTTKLTKYFLKLNDLVIGMDGSKVGKNVALVTKGDTDSLLVQRVARLRPMSNTSIMFVYQNIIADKFRRYVDIVNTSSGIPHISKKQIDDYKLGFPCFEEQTKIANFLSAIDQKIDLANTELEKAKHWKKGLLQQMFV